MHIHIPHLTLYVECQYRSWFTVSITVTAINRTIRRITHATSQAILVRSRFISDISNSVASVQAVTDTRRTVRRDANAIHLTPIGHILPVSISRSWLAHLNSQWPCERRGGVFWTYRIQLVKNILIQKSRWYPTGTGDDAHVGAVPESFWSSTSDGFCTVFTGAPHVSCVIVPLNDALRARYVRW